MAERLIAIGLALGGAAGERLSHRLGHRTADSTLLYLIAQLPLPPIVVPKTLGVDDFAFRKRQSYGTILVDLDSKSRPIGLLAGREAEILAQWLQEHPGIDVLSRDRCASYRSGMSQGAQPCNSSCRPIPFIAKFGRSIATGIRNLPPSIEGG